MKTSVVPARQRLVTKQQKASLVLVTLITGAAIGYLLGSSTHGSTTSAAHLLHVQQVPAIEVDPNRVEQKTTSMTISKFAYVFYATRADYYCAALVNAYQLIKLGKDPDIDILFITSTNFSPPEHQAATAESMEIKHISVESLPLGKFDTASGEYQGYYKDSMVKLSVFSLYKQGYTRIVFLDSDSLVLKNLEELFYLPSVSIAAPRAYWIDPGTLDPNCSGAMMGRKDGPDVGLQQKFTSALMIVEPSAEIWDRLLSKYWPGGKAANFSNMFDMDLLNIEFKDEVMLLPATQIFRLTSDWGPDGRIANRNQPGNEENSIKKCLIRRMCFI